MEKTNTYNNLTVGTKIITKEGIFTIKKVSNGLMTIYDTVEGYIFNEFSVFGVVVEEEENNTDLYEVFAAALAAETNTSEKEAYRQWITSVAPKKGTKSVYSATYCNTDGLIYDIAFRVNKQYEVIQCKSLDSKYIAPMKGQLTELFKKYYNVA